MCMICKTPISAEVLCAISQDSCIGVGACDTFRLSYAPDNRFGTWPQFAPYPEIFIIDFLDGSIMQQLFTQRLTHIYTYRLI